VTGVLTTVVASTWTVVVTAATVVVVAATVVVVGLGASVVGAVTGTTHNSGIYGGVAIR
jgi:ABC-type proline/glycine betaine transport system permease subunit